MARNIGKELNKKWRVGAQHALYRNNGTWYHRLERFPAALFDEYGYVVFESKEALEDCAGVLIGKGKNWLNVPDGIAALPGYVRAFRFPDEVVPHFYEGGKQSVVVNRYERDPQARDACIARHGCVCAVCDFDFGEKYGELGKGYIHVHHIVPLSQISQSYRVNPVTDLRPVCPNCHAMLHRREPVLTIEQLRGIILATEDRSGPGIVSRSAR
jgi:5-methylcytosine-specific restriction protein A